MTKSYQNSFTDVHLKPTSHSCRSDGVCKFKQPTQEPVAWVEYAWVTDDDGLQSPQKILHDYENFRAVPLYTHPQEWQGLTAEEIASIPLNEHTVQAIENLLRSKNLCI